MGTKQSSLEFCFDSQTLRDKYSFQSSHVLIHKATSQVCTLHQIGAGSEDEAESIQENISKYKASQCQSIMKVRQSYCLTNQKYCSNTKSFYLIFEGHNGPNARQQYLERRLLGEKFDDGEIEAIVSCMLCGLREYHKEFDRLNSWICLSSVLINKREGNGLVLKDPWLVENETENSSTPINFLASYPSPEKIVVQGNQHDSHLAQGYSQFQSALFSIGVLGLQLKAMNYPDDIYAHKKFVDSKKVIEYLNSIKSPRLRNGLAILLHEKANQRTVIYDFWRISCLKKYCIRYNHASAGITLPNQVPLRHQHNFGFMHPFNAQRFQVQASHFQHLTKGQEGTRRTEELPHFKTPTGRKQPLVQSHLRGLSHAKTSTTYPVTFHNSVHFQNFASLPQSSQASNRVPVYRNQPGRPYGVPSQVQDRKLNEQVRFPRTTIDTEASRQFLSS